MTTIAGDVHVRTLRRSMPSEGASRQGGCTITLGDFWKPMKVKQRRR